MSPNVRPTTSSATASHQATKPQRKHWYYEPSFDQRLVDTVRTRLRARLTQWTNTSNRLSHGPSRSLKVRRQCQSAGIQKKTRFKRETQTLVPATCTLKRTSSFSRTTEQRTEQNESVQTPPHAVLEPEVVNTPINQQHSPAAAPVAAPCSRSMYNRALQHLEANHATEAVYLFKKAIALGYIIGASGKTANTRGPGGSPVTQHQTTTQSGKPLMQCLPSMQYPPLIHCQPPTLNLPWHSTTVMRVSTIQSSSTAEQYNASQLHRSTTAGAI